MIATLDPAAFCRLDEALVAQVARGERLGPIALRAFVTTAVGAALYGAAFGLWRAPEQALFAAIKLPILLLGVTLATTAFNAMIALVLRAPLGLAQAATCILIAFAGTGTILAAFAPISALFALTIPPPDPSLVGAALGDPRVVAGTRFARGLVLYHVAVIAIAGGLGNVRLYGLLRRLVGRRSTALRVLAAWLAIDLLAGSELSWLLRPFVGWPHLAVTFTVDDPLAGGFFEEVAIALAQALGPSGMALVTLVAASLAVTTWMLLRPDGIRATLATGGSGLEVQTDARRFVVRWSRVHSAFVRSTSALLDEGHEVVVDVADFAAPRLIAHFALRADADALYARIRSATRPHAGAGPFRAAER